MPSAEIDAIAAVWFEHAHPEVGWEQANDWWQEKARAFAEALISSEWYAKAECHSRI